VAEKDEHTDDLTGLTDDERRKRGRAPDPVLPGEVAPKASPPSTVAVSFWLWIAAGALLILGKVQLLLQKQSITAHYIENNKDARVTNDVITAGVPRLLWFLLIATIIFVLLFALFAYKAREGTRSARTVLTVLPVVLVLLLLALAPGLPFFSLAGILLASAALVLMYLPSVASYFPKAGRKK